MTKYKLKISDNMTGKMLGMGALSTSTLDNVFCIAMHKCKLSICSKCFAYVYEKLRPNVAKAYKHNGDILSASIIPLGELPFINYSIFRFSAYGELKNIYHCINLFNIARINPNTSFTLWTKRADIVHKCIRDFGRPANIILIYSSINKNKRDKIPEHFDKVFTGYAKEYLAKNKQIKINCGAKQCISCRICYTKNNRTKYVNEIIK